MEVKSGYKQTDIGVIPSDWNVESLGSFASIASGGTPSRRIAEYWSGDIPWVTTTEIDFKTIRETEQFISILGMKNSAAKLLAPGTLLLALYGQGKTRGKVALLDISATTNQACASIALSPSVSRTFVFHYLSSQYRAIRNMSNSGSQENLSGQIVKSIPVPLPPTKTEQEAIATALNDADELIEALEELLTKKRDLKQGAMQELLTGKRRLPGFSGPWEIKAFGDLFSFSGGWSASRDQLSAEGHCYLHYGDIHKSSKAFVDLQTDYQDLPRLDIPLKRISSASLLEDGDVVFVDASEDDEGTSKHVVVVNKSKVPFISGLHTIVAKSKTNELVHEYRRYCFQTLAIRQQFLFYAVGTKVSGISKTNIAKLTLPVPGTSEQSAIAAILSDIDTEIAALEVKLVKARQLKVGMMQELLTGRIRLV